MGDMQDLFTSAFSRDLVISEEKLGVRDETLNLICDQLLKNSNLRGPERRKLTESVLAVRQAGPYEPQWGEVAENTYGEDWKEELFPSIRRPGHAGLLAAMLASDQLTAESWLPYCKNLEVWALASVINSRFGSKFIALPHYEETKSTVRSAINSDLRDNTSMSAADAVMVALSGTAFPDRVSLDAVDPNIGGYEQDVFDRVEEFSTDPEASRSLRQLRYFLKGMQADSVEEQLEKLDLAHMQAAQQLKRFDLKTKSQTLTAVLEIGSSLIKVIRGVSTASDFLALTAGVIREYPMSAKEEIENVRYLFLIESMLDEKQE